MISRRALSTLSTWSALTGVAILLTAGTWIVFVSTTTHSAIRGLVPLTCGAALAVLSGTTAVMCRLSVSTGAAFTAGMLFHEAAAPDVRTPDLRVVESRHDGHG